LIDKTGYFNMEKKIKAVEETLNRLYALQANHLASFGKQALPDLEKQSAERNIEVARLIRNVNTLLKRIEIKTEADTESMFFLNDRITGLLEQNKALEKKVHAVRENIKKNIKQVVKGKTVIGSYRSSAAAYTPRVISISN